MISRKLKLITREVLINILSRLLAREMRASIPIERKGFLTHCEECRINIQSSFDTRSARFTLTKMITQRQQFRAAQPILRIILNLFLTQVFHGFFF